MGLLDDVATGVFGRGSDEASQRGGRSSAEQDATLRQLREWAGEDRMYGMPARQRLSTESDRLWNPDYVPGEVAKARNLAAGDITQAEGIANEALMRRARRFGMRPEDAIRTSSSEQARMAAGRADIMNQFGRGAEERAYARRLGILQPSLSIGTSGTGSLATAAGGFGANAALEYGQENARGQRQQNLFNTVFGAKGGAIPGGLRRSGPLPSGPIEEPGADTEDTIPAVVEGQDGSIEPARFQHGEFAVDAVTHRWYGTRFFENLQRLAHQAHQKAEGRIRGANRALPPAPPPGREGGTPQGYGLGGIVRRALGLAERGGGKPPMQNSGAIAQQTWAVGGVEGPRQIGSATIDTQPGHGLLRRFMGDPAPQTTFEMAPQEYEGATYRRGGPVPRYAPDGAPRMYGGMQRFAGGGKVGKVMGEFQRGTLHSSSGQTVTERPQALAIALSEARRAGERVAPRRYAHGGGIEDERQVALLQPYAPPATPVSPPYVPAQEGESGSWAPSESARDARMLALEAPSESVRQARLLAQPPPLQVSTYYGPPGSLEARQEEMWSGSQGAPRSATMPPAPQPQPVVPPTLPMAPPPAPGRGPRGDGFPAGPEPETVPAAPGGGAGEEPRMIGTAPGAPGGHTGTVYAPTDSGGNPWLAAIFPRRYGAYQAAKESEQRMKMQNIQLRQQESAAAAKDLADLVSAVKEGNDAEVSRLLQTSPPFQKFGATGARYVDDGRGGRNIALFNQQGDKILDLMSESAAESFIGRTAPETDKNLLAAEAARAERSNLPYAARVRQAQTRAAIPAMQLDAATHAVLAGPELGLRFFTENPDLFQFQGGKQPDRMLISRNQDGSASVMLTSRGQPAFLADGRKAAFTIPRLPTGKWHASGDWLYNEATGEATNVYGVKMRQGPQAVQMFQAVYNTMVKQFGGVMNALGQYSLKPGTETIVVQAARLATDWIANGVTPQQAVDLAARYGQEALTAGAQDLPTYIQQTRGATPPRAPGTPGAGAPAGAAALTPGAYIRSTAGR